MFGRSRRHAPPAVAPEVAPWVHGEVSAELALLPAGRRRGAPSIVLTTGDVRVQLHVADVVQLVRGSTGIAESVGTPVAFLARPGAAAPTSVVAELVASAEPSSLVLLVEPIDRIAATLVGSTLESFADWVRALPR